MSGFKLFLPYLEPIRGHALFLPFYKPPPAFVRFCGEHPTLATSPHHDPPHRHTQAPWAQTAARLSHAASSWAQFLVRQRNFVPLRASGSSSMVKAKRMATGGGARRSTLTLARPPWRKKQSLVTLRRSEWSPWYLCQEKTSRRFARPIRVCLSE